MKRCRANDRHGAACGRRLALLLAIGALALAGDPVSATSVVPVTDRELAARADVIVHGVVAWTYVDEDALGRPETITSILPLEVLKGHVSGALLLHQLGGQLPDGRFFKLWGRPEYEAGHEVVVFAIARPEGGHQTAELVLGKFEVQQDDRGVSFAVPALIADAPGQVTVMRQRPAGGPDSAEADPPDDALAPRELDGFLRSLRGDTTTSLGSDGPRGTLTSSVHPEYLPRDIAPFFTNIGGRWRWSNGAAAAWTLDGQASIAGGGTAEAARAAASWSAQPDSTIGYTIGPGGANPMHLNALSSPCGWNTCMAGSGVIGCGGPGGGGTNSWRGDTYNTILGGEVWLRAYCTPNLWDSITTQAVLTHELGHTLGLGHSDAGASPHDVCRGDEDAAQMRSVVQHRTTLGTDDEDAVRWLYGDAGNSCAGGGPALSVTKTGAGSGTVSSVPAGISCGATCDAPFADGAVVTLSAAPGAGSVFAGWSGDADCADGSVTMNAARTCTARFDLRPDLLISALTAPSAALAGSTISIAEVTRSKGGPAAATTTRYYLSTNPTVGPGDTVLGFRVVPALAAGASSPAPPGLQLTLPPGAAAGKYYLIARADADGQVTESNESNNARATAIHIGPPDLVVSSLSASATSGTTAIAVTDITRNRTGTGPAAPTVTRFSLSTDAMPGAGDIVLGFRNVPGLPPGSSSSASTSLPVPPGTAPGTYYVIAKANADDSTPEVNAANNTRSTKIVLGPDLIVSSLSAPATGGAGLPVDVTDTTKNLGP